MAAVTADRHGPAAAAPKKPLWKSLYFQVICAIIIGIILGVLYPSDPANKVVGLAEQMKPLGDAFIKLIKMLIAPIIFCTVVHGIASMEDMKKVGRVGLKAIVYFEAMTTLALIIGLLVIRSWQPGVGMNVEAATIDAKSIQNFTKQAAEQSVAGYVLHIIPDTVVGAFAE